MPRRKRDYSITLGPNEFGSLLREINKKTKGVRNNYNALRSAFLKYEQPFCEIRQNHKGMNISIKLPEVKKKDVIINITETMIELKAAAKDRKQRTVTQYHRIINIPLCSRARDTKAAFKRETLKIKVPYEKIKGGRIDQPRTKP